MGILKAKARNLRKRNAKQCNAVSLVVKARGNTATHPHEQSGSGAQLVKEGYTFLHALLKAI